MTAIATAKAWPRLLADIGGTHARFGLETSPGTIAHPRTLATSAHADVAAAIADYLGETGAAPAHALLAVATPVTGDAVRMTNHPWHFSIAATRQALGLATLLVVNDFTALAMALPGLPEASRAPIGPALDAGPGPIALLGPGTGLGVSGVVPAGGGWVPLASEGGHVSLAPGDETEAVLLRALWREFPHVSAERLLCGSGIELLYRTLGGLEKSATAMDITSRALAGEVLAAATLSRFSALLGAVAGNLALTLGATGGVYVGGGIVNRLGSAFDAAAFRARFEAKGRFAGYLAAIPTWRITDSTAALAGAARLLARHLEEDEE